MNEIPCHTQESGWLLSCACQDFLLCLQDPVGLPFPAGLWAACRKPKEHKWLCLQPQKGPLFLTLLPSPSPYQQNSLPSFGPNAAGPACNHTVHVKVVCIIPSTVFCAYLENDNRLQLDSRDFLCCLGKVKTATWEEASPTDTAS